MGVAFKIAWRNIWRHKGKSLVIGIILFFGAFLMTVGNGMISGMEQGLAENISELFTGDIVIISDEQENDNVLFDVMNGKPLDVIKNYEDAEKVLQEEEIIQDFLPATAGMVMVFNSGSEMGSIMLLGIDVERYLQFFPDSFQVTEGDILKPEERGLLISEYARKSVYDFMDFWALPEGVQLTDSNLTEDAIKNIDSLEIRRDIVFMGASTTNTTMDIRVPVQGIIEYKALNQVWGNYCIIDIESFRESHNYVTAADSSVEISVDDENLLASDDLDQLFGSDELFSEDTATEESFSFEELQQETVRNEINYDVDAGSYNLAFVKLSDGISQQEALKRLNSIFEEENLNIKAISWKAAMGTIGSMAVMIKAALNVFIIAIFIVASIVIMNTLSMTAVERISELAMMRAIGARKGFLRKMFISETALISFFFGGIGIIAGVIVIYLISLADITTTNEILQMVYGGSKLSPLFTINDLLLGIAELGIVTILSVLYPLRVVGKIVPLDAIVRE
ncbi:MAG: ABC transporter permease [Halanaerobiales bacterium]